MSCELFAWQPFHKKYQSLFSLKAEKKKLSTVVVISIFMYCHMIDTGIMVSHWSSMYPFVCLLSIFSFPADNLS